MEDTPFVVDLPGGTSARWNPAGSSRPNVEGGQVSADLSEAGSPIDRADCVVAAPALREGGPVVTRNAERFRRVGG